MPGRTYNGGDYRYGFNGAEKDDEIKGDNNSLNFGARIYDPRVARWLSIDPRFKEYPDLSDYSFAANSPLIIVDPDGNTLRIVGSAHYKKTVMNMLSKLTNDQITIDRDGYVTITKAHPDGSKPSATHLISEIIASKNQATIYQIEDFAEEFQEDISSLKGNLTSAAKIEGGKTDLFNISPGEKADGVSTIDINDRGDKIVNADGSTGRPAYIGLAHELIHLKRILYGETIDPESGNAGDMVNPDDGKSGLWYGWDAEEIDVRYLENIIRNENNYIDRAEPYYDEESSDFLQSEPLKVD